MSRHIVCPSCATEFLVRGKPRDNRIKCPGCAVQIRLAAENPASRADQYEEEEEFARQRPRPRRSSSRSNDGMPLAYKCVLGGAVALGALIVTIYALQSAPPAKPKPEFRSEPLPYVKKVYTPPAKPAEPPPDAPYVPKNFVTFHSPAKDFDIDLPDNSRADDKSISNGVHLCRRCDDGTGYELLCIRATQGELNGDSAEVQAYVRGYVKGTVAKNGWQFKGACKEEQFLGRPSVTIQAEDGNCKRKLVGFSANGKLFVLSMYHKKDKDPPSDADKFFESFRAS